MTKTLFPRGRNNITSKNSNYHRTLQLRFVYCSFFFFSLIILWVHSTRRLALVSRSMLWKCCCYDNMHDDLCALIVLSLFNNVVIMWSNLPLHHCRYSSFAILFIQYRLLGPAKIRLFHQRLSVIVWSQRLDAPPCSFWGSSISLHPQASPIGW